MTVEEQIVELNSEVKCHIKPSKIDGVGVFALRDIKKDEKLYLVPNRAVKWYSLKYEDLDKLQPEIRTIILARWPSIILGSLFRSPNDDCLLASFVNHGGDNSNYEQNTDCATRDIKYGEEILEDY